MTNGGFIRAALSLAAALLIGLMAVPAEAAPEQGYRWPDGTTLCVQGGKAWGMPAAVRAWNREAGPAMVWRKSCGDNDGVRVPVAFVSKPRANWTGMTTYGYDGERRYQWARIELNKATAKRYAKADRACVRKWTAVHEFAHVVGLGHNHGADSVMSYEGAIQNCGTIRPADKREASRLYR